LLVGILLEDPEMTLSVLELQLQAINLNTYFTRHRRVSGLFSSGTSLKGGQMSYSRWSSSLWYTYYSVYSGRGRNGQVFQVCDIEGFTYEDMKADIERCLDTCGVREEDRRGKLVTPEERDELKGYMELFIDDVELEYGEEGETGRFRAMRFRRRHMSALDMCEAWALNYMRACNPDEPLFYASGIAGEHEEQGQIEWLSRLANGLLENVHLVVLHRRAITEINDYLRETQSEEDELGEDVDYVLD
jgi:hypothetical protein